MVKINNLEVIQKLVDELKLYPGTDQIPTDLAEKILPCFIINSQEIVVRPEVVDVVESIHTNSNMGSVTIYTTPAIGDFYLTNVAVSYSSLVDGIAGDNYVSVDIIINGSTKRILSIGEKGASSLIHGLSESLNLQNPILIDKGSIIVVTKSASMGSGVVTANIAGYTSD